MQLNSGTREGRVLLGSHLQATQIYKQVHSEPNAGGNQFFAMFVKIRNRDLIRNRVPALLKYSVPRLFVRLYLCPLLHDPFAQKLVSNTRSLLTNSGKSDPSGAHPARSAHTKASDIAGAIVPIIESLKKKKAEGKSMK